MKEAGAPRPCPRCGRTFRETLPLTVSGAIVWIPRPFCTHHRITAAELAALVRDRRRGAP